MGLDFTIGHKKTPATCQSFNNYILQSKDATGLHYYLNNKKEVTEWLPQCSPKTYTSFSIDSVLHLNGIYNPSEHLFVENFVDNHVHNI